MWLTLKKFHGDNVNILQSFLVCQPASMTAGVNVECPEEKEFILKHPASGMPGTFPSQNKWHGPHPGTHKTLQRMSIGSFSPCIWRVIYSQILIIHCKGEKGKNRLLKTMHHSHTLFQTVVLNRHFSIKISTRLINKESIYNLVFNFFYVICWPTRINVKDWVRALLGSHKQTKDNKWMNYC